MFHSVTIANGKIWRFAVQTRVHDSLPQIIRDSGQWQTSTIITATFEYLMQVSIVVMLETGNVA